MRLLAHSGTLHQNAASCSLWNTFQGAAAKTRTRGLNRFQCELVAPWRCLEACYNGPMSCQITSWRPCWTFSPTTWQQLPYKPGWKMIVKMEGGRIAKESILSEGELNCPKNMQKKEGQRVFQRIGSEPTSFLSLSGCSALIFASSETTNRVHSLPLRRVKT